MRCAYCHTEAPPTREHLWPRCIIERTPSYNARYFGKAEKFFGGDHTIKDVCAACNNGVLSTLDSYICNLYDAQLVRIAKPRQHVTFIYDYSMLARWLLKISFNTARANGTATDLLTGFSAFILNGGATPSDLSVYLELVQPAKNPRYKSGGMKWIPPQSVRCCRVEVPNNPVPESTVRLVAINSYYFWLAISPKSVDATPLLQLTPGKRLLPHETSIRVVPRRNTLDTHAEWVSNPKANQSMREFRRNAG